MINNVSQGKSDAEFAEFYQQSPRTQKIGTDTRKKEKVQMTSVRFKQVISKKRKQREGTKKRTNAQSAK